MADRQGHLKVCWWSATSDSSRWVSVGFCFVFLPPPPPPVSLLSNTGLPERADKYNSNLAVGVAHDWTVGFLKGSLPCSLGSRGKGSWMTGTLYSALPLYTFAFPFSTV